MLLFNSEAELDIIELGDNKYKMRLTRIESAKSPAKALVVCPELESVTLTDTFETEFYTNNPILPGYENIRKMRISKILFVNNGVPECILLTEGGENAVSIINGEFYLRKEDFDIMS